MSDLSPVLSLKNVYIEYEKKDVVFDVSFDVQPGEVFGLIGLNGVGKTTLIKTILGLKNVRAGHIDYVVKSHQSRSDAAPIYLPERFDPPWFLTGMEFVKFSLKLYKKSFSKEDVLACARRLALDEKALDRRVQSYSKGMRQKLGLIATVLTGSSLMILDEPMTGLDPLARSNVKDLLFDLKKDNQTLFICSHVLADLDEMCDKIAIMHDGRIIFCDSPDKLKQLTNQTMLERAFLDYINLEQTA